MATNNAINTSIPVGVPQGGTGAVTLASGEILLGNGTSAVSSTALLPVNKGGTGAATLTANGILLGNDTSAVGASAALTTNGQLLIGGTSGPAVANITGSGGITVTNGNGTIAISGNSGVSYSQVSGTSQTMVANNGYISTGSALTTYTLPSNASVGQTFVIMSSTNNTSFSKVIPGTTTQQIRLGTSITQASTGSITGTAIGDTLTIVCVDATTSGSEIFQVKDCVGNFTVV